MKPFAYVVATSLEEALEALSQSWPNAELIAGGQSLLLRMKERTCAPSLLVSISGLDHLGGWRYLNDGTLEIGATTTYDVLQSAGLRGQHCLIAEVAGDIADISVRNIGTIGGSLWEADPHFEMPVLAVTLGAEVVLASSSHTRLVPAAEFLQWRSTGARAAEIITALRFPPLESPDYGCAFAKWRYRQFDVPLVSVGCAIRRRKDDRIQDIVIVVGGAHESPKRAAAAERSLIGVVPSSDMIASAARNVGTEVAPRVKSGTWPLEYKRQLLEVLTARAVSQAWSRATGGRA